MSATGGRLTIGQTLIIITLLFIVAITGILVYTILTMNSRQSDAVVINIAGRQRMLNQMFLKEVLLAAQGHPANYRYTAEVWKSSLKALLDGGRAVLLGKTETVELPRTENADVRARLMDQHRLIDELVRKGEAFAGLPPDDPGAAAGLQELLALNDRLNDVTLAAARLYFVNSEARVASMLRWEVSLGLCVAVLGMLLSGQVVRTSRKLEEEVAQRKQAEEELRRSEAQRVEAFRQSDELKSALLSSVSHELRTPLTAIKSTVVGLMRSSDPLPEAVRIELLRGLDQEVDYLDRLVSNLLDMSRIEAGTLIPSRQWQPLEDLVEGAVRRTTAALQGRPLEIHLPDGVTPVYVDAVEIQQVLVNLLDNAAKYSPPGSTIRLTARTAGGEFEIAVANEGDGIPATDAERVFDRFYRLQTHRERSVRGCGLGLAICRGLVTAHGGRIWVESAPRRGTTVAFRIPTPDPEPLFPAAPAPGDRA
jgi:two-component system sensor histidine kinase KdpD